MNSCFTGRLLFDSFVAQPTVVVDVVLQHLVLQDAAQLRQGFQVDNVDDERPQDVVQGQAQLLQQLAARD